MYSHLQSNIPLERYFYRYSSLDDCSVSKLMESVEYGNDNSFSYCRISAIALSYAMGGKFDRKGPRIALIEGIQVSKGGVH